MHNNLYLPKGCPLILLWLASSRKTLRFELNTLNLALVYFTKHNTVQLEIFEDLPSLPSLLGFYF